MVASVGRGWRQELLMVRKLGSRIDVEILAGVRFVPMVRGIEA